MKVNYKDRMTIIMPNGGRNELYKALDKLGVKHSEGIREILTAFYQGRCTIEPRVDSMSNLFKNNKKG